MSPDTPAGRPRTGLTVFVAAMLTIILIAASLLIGRATAPADTFPGSRSVEAGFSRDMQTHHQQAVEMSMIVRDRTDDPEIRLLAYDIATSQSQQAGQMFGWLAVWGLPQAAQDPPMAWMHRPLLGDDGHTTHAPDADSDPLPAEMPGMATREQLDELSRLSGRAAERLFLELMTAHHEGGVEMAESVIERSDHPVVTDLAGSIVAAQNSEIELMQTLLADRPETES